jgi:thiamine-monophosphate kinase
MHSFAEKNLINAAMDNSDGLLPTLSELASKNSLGAILDLEMLSVPGLTPEEVPDAARYWLGWGDWNVIVSASPTQEEQILRIAKDVGAPVCRIGRFTVEHSGVMLRCGENMAPSPRLESERFAKDSWMLKGIGEYVRMLKDVKRP